MAVVVPAEAPVFAHSSDSPLGPVPASEPARALVPVRFPEPSMVLSNCFVPLVVAGSQPGSDSARRGLALVGASRSAWNLYSIFRSRLATASPRPEQRQPGSSSPPSVRPVFLAFVLVPFHAIT